MEVIFLRGKVTFRPQIGQSARAQRAARAGRRRADEGHAERAGGARRAVPAARRALRDGAGRWKVAALA